jgi:anti-sigma-K factor RskA
MSERCHHADTVASYLLGALPQDESASFEQHLADCPACREDVAGLRVVVDRLPAASPPADPPLQLRERIVAAVHAEAELLQAAGPSADRVRRPARERRGSRRFALAGSFAAVALAAVAGGFGLRAATDNGTTRTVVQVRTVQASVTGPAGAGGRAAVVLRSGVATLRVKGLPAPPKGYVYEVWLLKRGAKAPSPTDALFSVNHRGDGRVALPSTAGVTTVLVTAEPDGGSPAPTTTPFITAPL